MDLPVDESSMDISSVGNDDSNNGTEEGNGTRSDPVSETEKEEMPEVVGSIAVIKREIKDRICGNSTCDQSDPELVVAPSCAVVYFGLLQSMRKTHYICHKCLEKAEEYRAVSSYLDSLRSLF